MKITKLGHCCLLIEENSIRILTDPGTYSTAQNDIRNIDVVLITHEHADHIHIDSLRLIIENNPKVKIVTNKSVGLILDKEGITYSLVEDTQSIEIGGVVIEGFGTEHAYIYETVKRVENTCYFINKKLFYPGDSFHNPNMVIPILALPVAGPWMKISDAIEYAKKLKPGICFPVHDGMLKEDRLGPIHRLPESVLTPLGIKFVVIKEGESGEF